jgi:hypothetical protein
VETTGYAINKRKLLEIYEKYPIFGEIVKRRTYDSYCKNIRQPIVLLTLTFSSKARKGRKWIY